MSPGFNEKVRQIYDEALELPKAKRARFLEFACADSADVRREVLNRLEAQGEIDAAPAGGSGGGSERNPRIQKISRYVIKGELGKGAMGAVYEAVDPVIGRTVALKVLHSNMVDEEEAKSLEDRLFREASSAGRLAHPGIVTVYDVGKEGEMAFIAMERVEGPTLQHMMKERRFDRPQALELLRQAALAMDYAHGEGIIHRDIKPANIMLHKGIQAKIADFGIAKVSAMSQLTVAGTILGTPSYMSPEQIQNLPLSGRSDQFSLAVVGYEMLTGAKPFDRDTMPALLLAIVNGERPSASAADRTLPPMVDEVFKMALSKLPEQRFATCSAFVNALASSLGIEFAASTGSLTGSFTGIQNAQSGAHPAVSPAAFPPPPPQQSLAATVTGQRAPLPPPLPPPPPTPARLADTAVNFAPPQFPPPPMAPLSQAQLNQAHLNQKKPPTVLYVAGGLLLIALAAAYPVYRYIYPKPVPEPKHETKQEAKKDEMVIPPTETKPGAPVVSLFTAEPDRVQPGGTATLRWWVTDALEVVISQEIGKVAGKGSIEVKPQKDTEYILTATGGGGEATARVTVTVGADKPPVQPEKNGTKVSSVGGATSGKPPAAPGSEPTHVDTARAQQLYEEGMTKHRGQPGSVAIPSFEQAAAMGEPRAMLELGKIYSAGDGVAKDPAKAAGWYRKSADLGNASAMVFLGALYAQGSGVPKDLTEAAKWIRKAADAGNAVAMDGLGQMYANGQGLPVDVAEAVAWYRKAVDNNNAPAMYHLGLILENGAGPVAKNPSEAAQLFQRSANAGYAPAKAKLAGSGPVTLASISPESIVANKSQMYRLTGSGFSAATTVRSDIGALIGSRDGLSDFHPVAVAPNGSWLAVYISLPPPPGRTIRLTVKNPGGPEASLDVTVQK
jgi:serine/threonine protein kinase/TPR repeat protein